MSARVRTYRFAGCVALVLTACGEESGAASSGGVPVASPEITTGVGGSKSRAPNGFFKDATSIPLVVRASVKGNKIRVAQIRITDRSAAVDLTVDGGPLQTCSMELGSKECVLYAASRATRSDELMMDLAEVRFGEIPKEAARSLGVDVRVQVDEITIERKKKGADYETRATGEGGKFH